MTDYRIFLLSPASCTGRRAQTLLRDGAGSALATGLRDGGVPLADVFSFLSALYFRGKVTYARAFAAPPPGAPGILVITSSRGLVSPGTLLTVSHLEEFAHTDIGTHSPTYMDAILRSACALAHQVDPATRVVLLGSIATGKYVDPLREVFGPRLVFPADFVGRGDMSRGGLLLRCVEAGRELDYVATGDVPRRGRRPPRLVPRRPDRPARPDA